MSKVRVCFLGTPEFAVTCLQQLVSDEHFDVVGVVTQPDRPAGRKMVLTPTPVKVFAQAHNIPVISPESVNKDPILEQVTSWRAEVAVVVAFGQIVSQKFLNLFPHGCVNVHGSLLPLWRGAAPIQRAIQNGDRQTGVALQKMVRELDAGDVIGVRTVDVDPDMNAKELYERLAKLGGELLHIELMDYVRGNLIPVPQDASKVTYAKKIEKTEAEINWSESAEQIHNKVRAFAMGPGTWTTLDGKKVKIHRTALAADTGAIVGCVLHADAEGIVVSTGQGGSLRILELQPESRNRMSAQEFLRSHPVKKGTCFGVKI